MTWAAIPAVLKVTRNVNEVISTIMLNYIATYLGLYLLRHYLDREDPNVAETGVLPKAARIPSFNSLFEAVGFHMPNNVVFQGYLPVAVAVGIGYYLVLNRSRFGFDLRVSGANPSAARASGINPKRMVMSTMLISGGLAGLIGLAPLMADQQYYRYGDQFPQSLGFTGLSLALLGRNSPIGIAFAALVWATIARATQRLSFIGIPQEIGTILQGTFLLAAVISFEVVNRHAEAAEAAALSRQRPMPPPAPLEPAVLT
jgi:simple sugar transport system permease protein